MVQLTTFISTSLNLPLLPFAQGKIYLTQQELIVTVIPQVSPIGGGRVCGNCSKLCAYSLLVILNRYKMNEYIFAQTMINTSDFSNSKLMVINWISFLPNRLHSVILLLVSVLFGLFVIAILIDQLQAIFINGPPEAAQFNCAIRSKNSKLRCIKVIICWIFPCNETKLYDYNQLLRVWNKTTLANILFCKHMLDVGHKHILFPSLK